MFTGTCNFDIVDQFNPGDQVCVSGDMDVHRYRRIAGLPRHADELGAGVFRNDHATWMLQLERGDFFLCSSGSQRLFSVME